MTRKTPVDVAASVRARLLKVSKERREDFTLTLVNYASERILYRLSKSRQRDQFILKGAMLFAARIGEPHGPHEISICSAWARRPKRPLTRLFATSSPLMSLTMALSSTWTHCGF